MVEVTVVDSNGRVIDKREINRDLFEEYIRREEANGDLTTRWFIRMLFYLFKYTTKSGSETASVVDTDGSARSVVLKGVLGSIVVFNNIQHGDMGFYIGVGNGTASPTRDDYRLASKVADAYASASVDENAGTITLSASFTFGTDQTITEISLEWLVICGTTTAVNARVLCDRTVLSQPVTVPAGATLSVAYRFRL
jgi:hypothetical protein